jgi:hypothetical protein
VDHPERAEADDGGVEDLVIGDQLDVGVELAQEGGGDVAVAGPLEPDLPLAAGDDVHAADEVGGGAAVQARAVGAGGHRTADGLTGGGAGGHQRSAGGGQGLVDLHDRGA